MTAVRSPISTAVKDSGCLARTLSSQRAADVRQAGRNILSGPGTLTVDTSVSDTIRLMEAHRVQLRFGAFNLPNRPTFSDPIATLTSPVFGTIRGAGAGRILQVSAKYVF